MEAPNIMDGILALCQKGADWELLRVTSGGVMEVCGARFTRLAKQLEIPGGTVELALDEGILFSAQRDEALCEVEVELKSGSREGAYAYAMALAGTFGLQREMTSKFRRALALTEGE